MDSSDGRLPVDDAEEILLRARRDLGVLDLVVLIDSALGPATSIPSGCARSLATSATRRPHAAHRVRAR